MKNGTAGASTLCTSTVSFTSKSTSPTHSWKRSTSHYICRLFRPVSNDPSSLPSPTRDNLEPRSRQSTYYGYSFESWCTSSEEPSPDQIRTPTWGGDVDTAVQWCGVVKTKLGNTRLILGGEVDCVRGSFTGQTDTFLELKTSIAIRPHHAGDESKFEK